MLRPSAYLTFVFEGDDIAAGKASAAKRAYSYVAPTKILAGRTEAAEGEAPLTNRIALDVRLDGYEPWSDDTVWSETLLPWLDLKINKLFGTVYECNNEARKSFCGTTFYQEFDLSLCGVNLQVALEPASGLRDLNATLAAIRAWRRDAADKGVRFVVPSDTQRGDSDWFDVVLTNGETVHVDVDASKSCW